MDAVVKLLSRYIEEIELFNPAYGLVKVKDRRELIVRHILDSLAPLGIIRHLLDERPRAANAPAGPETPAIADVGSGAGLPGIPLAICMPGAQFTLIERMGRRAGFLRNVAAVLSLPNVRVEETEMERAEGLFDVIVFRAFSPLKPAILKSLTNLLAPDGVITAYKGRRESLEEELDRVFNKACISAGISGSGWETLSREIIPLEVPFLEEERHLLLLRRAG